MEYGSLSFLLVFLPLSVVVYYIAPRRARNAVLLAVSLVFYLLLDPRFLLLMLLSVAADYLVSGLMARYDGNPELRRLLVFTGVLKNIGLIVGTTIFCTYYQRTMPVGLFVYTLTATGYLVDLYKRQCEYEKKSDSVWIVLHVFR